MDNTGTFADDSIDSLALADGAATYNYGANGNALISENRGGASKYYHSDGLGSTTALTNSSESTTDTRVTDAFGNLITSSGSTPTPFGFGGQSGYQADSDTGLKLCGARYYDSSAGRFLSRDPAFSGTNWYTYCGNDPVNGMDSTGLGSPSTAPGWITQTSPLLPPPGWNGGNGGGDNGNGGGGGTGLPSLGDLLPHNPLEWAMAAANTPAPQPAAPDSDPDEDAIITQPQPSSLSTALKEGQDLSFMEGTGTQASQNYVDYNQVNSIVGDLQTGNNFWDVPNYGSDTNGPVTISPSGVIQDGHHRYVASVLANKPIPASKILIEDRDRHARPWSKVIAKDKPMPVFGP